LAELRHAKEYEAHRRKKYDRNHLRYTSPVLIFLLPAGRRQAMYVQEVVRLIYITYFIGISLFMVFFIVKVKGKE
jgi:hypothetical protein